MVTRFWARPIIAQGSQRTSPWMAFCLDGSSRGAWALDPLEVVTPVAEPVGPRGQHLTPAAVAPFVGPEPVDHRVGPPP